MKKKITALLISLATASQVYADDLLTSYQQAQMNDPVILKAHAQFLAAEDGIDIARASLLPQISASAGFETGESESGNITTESTTTNWGARLNMQLYHHDTWLRFDSAEMGAHRADVSYQAAKQDLIIRVSQAYFGVLQAQDDLEFSIAEKASIERQLEQTKQKYSVGLNAITDVHEAQAQYDNAVTAQIRAENTVANAKEALRVITNVYPRDLSTLDTDKFSTSQPVPNSADEWQQTAEAKNLNLIIQKIGVDIAKQDIDIARSGHYPTLDLTGNVGSSDTDRTIGNAPETNSTSDSYSVGVSFSVPIYSGGATSSRTNQAKNNYVAASQDLAQTHRNVVLEVRNSYNLVIAAISAIKALEQSVISAESALKATEAGFEVGTRTIVDVLDSTRNLYNAKRNLSSTRYGYIEAILALKRSGGTITEQDIIDINAGLVAVTK